MTVQRSRLIIGVSIFGLLVQGVAIMLIVTDRSQILLPITATLGARTLRVTTMDLSFAVFFLIALAVLALAPLMARRRAVDGVARATESVIIAPVVVFLVACLNGVTEVAALVPIYALASGAAALIALEPVRDIPSPRRRLSLAAAIGIVPWGVIAFTQIGSLIAGDPPSILVRVITLAMLAGAILRFVLDWRMRRTSVDLTAALLVTSGLSYSVFGWFVVAGVVSGSPIAQ